MSAARIDSAVSVVAPPRRFRRLRSATVLTAMMATAISAAAIGGVRALDHQQEQSRSALELIPQVQMAFGKELSAAWQAVADWTAPGDAAPEMAELQEERTAVLTKLAQSGLRPDVLSTLAASLTRLDGRVAQFISDRDEAGRSAMLAAVNTVSASLSAAAESLRASAATADAISTAGTVLVILLSVAAVIAVMRVSERRRRRLAMVRVERAALSRSEEQFRLLFFENPQPMWLYDAQTLAFLAVNDVAVAHYGYSRDEFLAMRITDIRAPEEIPLVLDVVNRREAQRGTHWRHRTKGGAVIDVEIHSRPHVWDGRRATLVIAWDVTERNQLVEQLRHQALHDALTRLPNRVLLRDRAEQGLRRAARVGGAVTLLVLELDGFKGINDVHGHDAGDQVLVDVATRLGYALRAVDTAARLGGDEFAVVLEGMTREGAIEAAGRVLGQFAAPFSVGDRSVHLSASIGIAETGTAGGSFDELLHAANVAVHEAKAHGKARYEVFEAGMASTTLRHLEIAGELRVALDSAALEVHYQPVISVGSGAIQGAEALVRWRHPTRGLMSPAEFIPCAEETGMIVPLGAWILRQACRDARSWAAAEDGDPLSLSVNVSSRQLREPDFATSVLRILDDTGFDPSRLVLEVTETMLVEDMDLVRHHLCSLRSMGIRVALDDFGAGYSSLGYLRALPLDTVKIDRVFVRDLGEAADDRALLAAMVRLLKGLDLTIVVEGIETADQLALVATLGVDAAQGFFFSRPVCDKGLHAMLRGGTRARWSEPAAFAGTDDRGAPRATR